LLLTFQLLLLFRLISWIKLFSSLEV
jgi:hypothetical protein